MKTNAVRVLERAGIVYQLLEYHMGEAHVSAEEAALRLKMAPETVFKTLLAHGDQTGPLFALIPAGTHLDLRALAAASGNKRVELVPLRDVQTLTGYVRGAVTALAARRAYSVVIDETVMLWPRVGISGGLRGLEIVLAPADLVRVTSARLADIARQDGEHRDGRED
jgi:Cys-tRNA(Pro)/Cys-tRNA(Cys) deacylase